MEVKGFTDEEMDALRKNPYTYKVTQCHLSFTAEFKELFWKHYNEEMTPKDILLSPGYDPDVLEESRVNGIRMHIKEEFGDLIDFFDSFPLLFNGERIKPGEPK